MAIEVDFSSIFDIVLPNVYIKKIAISHSSLSDEGSASHYDEDVEYFFEKNRFGKKLLSKRQSESFQQIATGKFLLVKAKLVIKDYIKKNNKPHWVENEEILNFLKLRVLLSTKSQVTDDLRTRGLTEKNIKRYKNSRGLKERVISLRRIGKRKIESYKKEKIDGKTVYSVTYNVSYKVYHPNPRHLAIFAGAFVDLNEYAQEKKSPIQSHRRFLFGNLTGQLILNRGEVARTSNVFMLPNGKVWAGPVHFQKDVGFMSGPFHTEQPHSILIKREIPNILVEDYRLLERAESAKLLLRPKRIKSLRRRKGKSRPERFRKRIKSPYISEPDYSTNRKGEVFMTFHVNFAKMIKEKTQFGAMASGADRVAFERITELTEIKNLKVFRNRVQRGMKRGESKLVDYDDRTELIAEASSDKLRIGETVQLTKPKNSYDENTESIIIGSIREVDLKLRNSGGIRTFAVSDLGMDKKTDGFYSYSVQFELVDGTGLFVEEELNKLTNARNLLIEYYGISAVATNTDIESGEYTQAFRDRIEKLYNIPSRSEVLGRNKRERRQIVRDSLVNLPWNNAVASFIDVLGNITDLSSIDAASISAMLYTLVRPDTGTAEGINTVVKMIERLESQILKSLHKKSHLVSELDFNSRTAAYKGKMPRNIINVRKRFDKVFNSNVMRNVGFAFFSGQGSRQESGHKTITSRGIKRRFTREHSKYFNNAQLGGTEPLPEGISNKFDLEKNFFAYLAPSKIHIGLSRPLALLDRGESLFRKRQYDRIASNRLATNPRASTPSHKLIVKSDPLEPIIDSIPPINFTAGYDSDRANISEESYEISSANASILGPVGVVIQSPAQYEIELQTFSLLDGEDESAPSEVDPKMILGDNTKFASDPIEIESLDEVEVLTGQLEEDFLEIGNVVIDRLVSSDNGLIGTTKGPSIRQLTGKNSVVNSKFDSKEDPARQKAQFYGKMPNQLKSLFLSRSSIVKTNWLTIYRTSGEDLMRSSSLANLFYYNYQHINQVQALIGFEKDDRGEPQVSSPVYRRLNRRIIERIENRNRTVLCRMVPYSNKLLKTKKSKKLHMTEYDENFFIIPVSSTTTETELQQEEELAEIQDFITDTSTGDEELISADSDELFRGMLAARLVEYSDLNRIGRKALKTEINRAIIEDRIPPEFQYSLVVLQPKYITRIGTSFGSEGDDARKRVVTSESGVRAALSRRVTARSSRTDVITTTGGGGSAGGRGSGRGGY